jgi:hypothetical protein
MNWNWYSSKSETRFIWTMAAIITIIVVLALIGYLTGGWNATD